MDCEAPEPLVFSRPTRNHPTHLPNIERHNQPVILYVTVCTQNRKPILANARVHDTLQAAWSQSIQYRVGRYVIMPDHIHLFCSPAVPSPEKVNRWVAYWKRITSLELKDLSPIWQRDCWDTQLRHAQGYDEKWAYVVRNPVRKGLVPQSETWHYQGCLNHLQW